MIARQDVLTRRDLAVDLGGETLVATLQLIIEKSAEILPSQGPISAFAFLNTLQALEHLPFHDGLKRGARLYGCQPFLPEGRYREMLARGRILPEDLKEVLREKLGTHGDERIAGLATRYEIRLAMLQFYIRSGPDAELKWYIAETDALTKMCQEVPSQIREKFLAETQRWVMRDVGEAGFLHPPATAGSSRSFPAVVDLIERFGEAKLERWKDSTWEAFSLQALWRACRAGVSDVRSTDVHGIVPLRARDDLLDATAVDCDAMVNGMLGRFCASFVDQGFAHWAMPDRSKGLYRTFIELYQQSGGPPNRWLRKLPDELKRIERAGLDPLESICESLQLLGIEQVDWEDFIIASLLAMRGWAGMIWQMEFRPDRVPFPANRGSLTEFLAIRLILDRIALAYVAKSELDYSGPLDGVQACARGRIRCQAAHTVDQRAFGVFQLAQFLGWLPKALFELPHSGWEALVREMEEFAGLERRALMHTAFERRYRVQALDAISIHCQKKTARVEAPRFQAVFCLDAREESFRRHLEEIAPNVETYAMAGFYGIAMYFKGVADAHFSTLCPIVVQPKHWVTEDVVYTFAETNRRRAKARKALGNASHKFHVGTRGFAGGAVLSAGVGVLASIPLIANILFPRLTATLRKTAGQLVEPPLITRLALERTEEAPGPEKGHIGFSLEEMANLGERALRDIGLTSNFARIVIFMGHGSFCLNNPHKSAYDCGACSGCAGGPNARALAVMLNDLRVRQILVSRGIEIPRTTYFMGALHNTCADSVTFLDLDLLPHSHLHDFELARETLEKTCSINAHERCRRFESAPLSISIPAARRHVEERSVDLAQTRPEYGNASNALCIVGRRQRTRGLFLDRRSFLMSYDPEQDDEDFTILGRTLAAVIPVCEGINLQYTLSFMDNCGWGCGTKLPHNVSGLLGVMEGAESDLRPGLPFQSVDIHEPVRLLFVLETTTDAILKIMERDATVRRILENGWAQLAILDPNSSKLQVFDGQGFHPYEPSTTQIPQVPASIDWYRGWRDNLGFAAIGE